MSENMEGKDKKAENLEDLDITMEKTIPADGEVGPSILGSRKASASATICGKSYACNPATRDQLF